MLRTDTTVRYVAIFSKDCLKPGRGGEREDISFLNKNIQNVVGQGHSAGEKNNYVYLLNF